MNLDKDFKKWLEENKMLIKSNSDKEKTHNVMEYGRFLSIKPQLEEDFLQKLSQTLEDSKVNYLLEIRTDYFKFMVDVDFKSEYELSIKNKYLLMQHIFQAVNIFVGNQADTLTIVSSCDDEKINYHDQELIKVGFHLIWPNLIVSVEEALYLRSAIIQYLENSDLKIFSLEDWTTVIDKSIYGKNHALRMNGSSKHVSCPKCKNKKSLKNDCEYCDTSGWINVGRVYKPYLIFNNDGTTNEKMLDKLNNSFYDNLKYTSIRTKQIKSNIKIPSKFPEWFSKNKYETHIHSRQRKKKIFTSHPFVKTKLDNQLEISENDIRYNELTKFLNSELFKLDQNFNDIEFDKLKKITTGNKIKKHYYIFSTRCYYCMNMKREHSSNHIYFVIDEKTKTIYHKCPSPWKNSKGVLCQDYRSNVLSLPKNLHNLLFNENAKVVKDKSEEKKERKSLLCFSIND